MYIPDYFKSEESLKIFDILERYPFAVLMSTDPDGKPFFSHLPLLVQNREGVFYLQGHMAKRNPQWRHWKTHPCAHIIFNGPHTYVTPNWYSSGRDVPTWNYVAVHVDGPVRLIEDSNGMIQLLKEITQKFESPSPTPWEFELPDDLLTPESLESAIVGFEIRAEKIDAKFKLNQNRAPEDQRGVTDGLATRDDDMSLAVRELMLGHQISKGIIPKPFLS